MSAEVNVSVEENLEAVAPATDSTEHNDVSTEVQENQQRKRNDAEYNWAEMRREMREKDQQIEELRQQFSKTEKDDLVNLAEDDILTVGQARRLAKEMAKKVAEDAIKKRDAETVEERMQLKYPDYSEIVSKENIELLKQTEPELAQSLYHMPDPYSQAVAAYKLIKRISVKKEDSHSMEKRKVLENSQKPLSVNAVTKNSAIGNAHLFENGLTKELKGQLWEEMKEAMKG